MFFNELKGFDPEMFAACNSELERQQHNIELIASENFVSKAPAKVIEMERKKQADAESKIKSIEESISLLKEMEEIGFKNVILTPHYIEGSEYCSNNIEKKEKFKLLKEELVKKNINIKIYLGNEIFINKL